MGVVSFHALLRKFPHRAAPTLELGILYGRKLGQDLHDVPGFAGSAHGAQTMKILLAAVVYAGVLEDCFLRPATLIPGIGEMRIF